MRERTRKAAANPTAYYGRASSLGYAAHDQRDGSHRAPLEPRRPAAALAAAGVPVATGVFGAKMAVELVNDRPVIVVLDA